MKLKSFKFNLKAIICIVITLSLIFFIGLFSLKKEKLSSTAQVLEKSNNEKVVEKVDKEKEIKEFVKSNSNRLTKLVNKNNTLPNGYKPDDLIKTNVKSCKTVYVSKLLEKSLENMFRDANKENLDLVLVSGFRSSNIQQRIYNNSMYYCGKEYTDKYVAKPNQSEHQIGLAVDISCEEINNELEECFKNTLEGKWLAENSYKYGFILRYTEDRTEDTGYGYEPWHFRYVGVDVAKYMYENNLILEDLY